MGKTPGLSVVFKFQVAEVSKRFVGNGGRRHFVDYLLYFFFFARHGHALNDVVGKKVDKILAGYIAGNAIANVQVAVAVVICVKNETTPTPIACRHAAVVRRLIKLTVAVVYLQGVLHVLVVKPLLHF